MTLMRPDESKAALRSELDSARTEFHHLVDSLSESQLRQRSHNPGWTNGEILFHMVLGFSLIPILVPLLRVFHRFPRRYSKAFADLLNSATPLFNFANAMAARIGARIFRRKSSLHKQFDRIYRRIIIMLDSMRGEDLPSGMYYPHKWDSLFDAYMTADKLFNYPIRHFRFHVDQISR
jgi:hypothetical protein